MDALRRRRRRRRLSSPDEPIGRGRPAAARPPCRPACGQPAPGVQCAAAGI